MFIAALFTTAKLWKQPGCPNTDELIKKMWYYTQRNSTQPRRRTFASKCMELENIILSEVNQAQKTNKHMFSLMCEL
jgi:hypothetical protein